MKIQHAPLELLFTERLDYELVLYNAIDYMHPRIFDKQTRRKLEEISANLFVADTITAHSLSTNIPELEGPYRLTGDAAHLAVRAIDTFVEGTVADLDASPRELRIAGYGKEILELVRADIPA
jgi:hypothetical protein